MKSYLEKYRDKLIKEVQKNKQQLADQLINLGNRTFVVGTTMEAYLKEYPDEYKLSGDFEGIRRHNIQTEKLLIKIQTKIECIAKINKQLKV